MMQVELLSTPRVKEIEAAIMERKGTMALCMLEIGDFLIEAKQILPHGDFTEWLSDNVMISDRTARNYMRAAQAFPKEKRQTFSVLSSSKVILLAELPERTRDNLDVQAVSDMSVRELQDYVRKEKETADGINVHFAATTEEGNQKFEIEINKLKPYPKYDEFINKYYRIRRGREYIGFLKNFDTFGWWPIKITKDNVIIDGHERVRAAKDLGLETITASYVECARGNHRSLEQALDATFLNYQECLNIRTPESSLFSCLYYDCIGDEENAKIELRRYLSRLEEEERYPVEIFDKIENEDLRAELIEQYWSNKETREKAKNNLMQKFFGAA